jgi:hypothetical protein
MALNNRLNWTFQYGAEVLGEAAKARQQHHEARLLFWETTKAVAETELRDSGISLRDYEVSGGKRIEAVVDPSLSNRYSEATERVDSHYFKLGEYDRYIRAFAASGSKVFELTIDDMNYFGL